jgi:hypothetical protein
MNSSNGQVIALDQGSNATSGNDIEDENDEDDDSSDND